MNAKDYKCRLHSVFSVDIPIFHANIKTMKRRDILKYTAMATGAVLSAPLILSLNGCRSELKVNYIPTFFDLEELAAMGKLVDIILPKTDSPAATEVGVHQTIDSMVANVYTAEEQKDYREGFDALKKYLSTAPDISSAVKSLESAEQADESTHVKAYRALKQQAMAYYLSSEQVITDHLNYLPVPGEYKPCIDVTAVGNKAWAI